MNIIQYTGEQRMTWNDAIHQKYYADRSMDAVKSTIRRLIGRPHQNRYLRSEPLDGKRVCYYLTDRSVRMLGLPAHVSNSLGRTALMRHYALQWFFELDGQNSRWKCKPKEHPELFPSVKEQLPKAHFFLQVQENRTELGVAIVDFGSDARRIVRRTVDLLNRFLEHGWFDEFLAAGAFGVTYLTLTEGKCLAIAKHFERDCERRLTLAMNRISRTANIQADYLVVPRLVDLLPT